MLLHPHVRVMKVLLDQIVLRFDVKDKPRCKKRGDLQTRNTPTKGINKSSTTYAMESFLAHEIKRNVFT
jgi:hypothetical protein